MLTFDERAAHPNGARAGDEARPGLAPSVIAAARHGDRGARERVGRRALELSVRTAVAVAGSREDASDIAQDVAIEVLRGLDRLREPERFDAWVHRITVRRALRVSRANRLKRHRQRSLSGLPERSEPAQPTARIEPGLSPALLRALLALPVRQRLVVALRYVHDLSEQSIATALDCPPGTVASLLSRARSTLRGMPEIQELATNSTSDDRQ